MAATASPGITIDGPTTDRFGWGWWRGTFHERGPEQLGYGSGRAGYSEVKGNVVRQEQLSVDMCSVQSGRSMAHTLKGQAVPPLPTRGKNIL